MDGGRGEEKGGRKRTSEEADDGTVKGQMEGSSDEGRGEEGVYYVDRKESMMMNE